MPIVQKSYKLNLILLNTFYINVFKLSLRLSSTHQIIISIFKIMACLFGHCNNNLFDVVQHKYFYSVSIVDTENEALFIKLISSQKYQVDLLISV